MQCSDFLNIGNQQVLSLSHSVKVAYFGYIIYIEVVYIL